MSFLNLQEVDDHHHDHDQNRTVEDDHNHMGSRGSIGSKSYDCVFCQRGFNTAQALGGHMNIHRKDRATTNKPNSSPNKESINTIFNNKEVLLVDDNDDYDDDQVDQAINTRLFYSSKQDPHHSNGGTSRFKGKIHGFIVDHMHEKRIIQDHDVSIEREEVDLELRLGHYPW
ncbi:unnamed protein product [Amaranthus hypochondriacus]